MLKTDHQLRVYLDCCALQRRFDDRSQLRIRLESEAINAIFELFEVGSILLLNSEILEFELSLINDSDRRDFCTILLRQSSEKIIVTDAIERQAREAIAAGIKLRDALHLACAMVSKADYFCTCDDRLYRSARIFAADSLRIVKPIQFIEELDP